jgi:hypothetical protein
MRDKMAYGSRKPAMPRWLIVGSLAALCFCACADRAPYLGRDLPRTWSDHTPYFDARVQQRYPIGSDESGLRHELQAEGFKIRRVHDVSGPFDFAASYIYSRLPCRETWRIQWDATQGRVTRIQGWYNQVCL